MSSQTPSPQLVRSRDDRLLAGVCGGIAGRLGIDAVILRVLVVVLALFGGAGILLYALGWLLLPVDDGRGRSELEDAFDARTTDRFRHLLTVVALVAVIAVSSVWALSGNVVPGVLVVLTVVALLMLARRDIPGGSDPSAPYGPPRTAPVAPGYGPSSGSGPSPGYGPPSPEYAPTESTLALGGTEPTQALGTDSETTATRPAQYPPSAAPWPDQQHSNVGQPPYEPPYVGSPVPAGPPPPPPPPRDRSHLGLLTVSVALVALGALAAVDLSTVDVPGGAYVALALGVVAVGLLVGAWFGRSRGLIALGIVLSAALVPAVVLDTVTDGDWSELRSWGRADRAGFSPTSAAEIQPAYELGSGQLTLDLRGVDFTGDDVTTSVDAGAGEVVVLLPPEVDVTADAAVNLGELDLLGFTSGGFDLGRSITDLGADGSGGGQLTITIDANVGRVEVSREAA